RHPDRFARRRDQRAGLGLAFALLIGRVGIGDDAGAGLDVQDSVLDDTGTQHDATVDRAVGREIADAAGIGAACLRLQLGDDLTGVDLGRAADGAGGKAREYRVDRVVLRAVEPALDIGDDMHDVAVAFDRVALGHAYAARARYPADVVAAEVEQHQ